MSNNKDYTKYSFYITILVIMLLVALIYVPPFSIGSTYFKRGNILSDILKIEDSLPTSECVDTTLWADVEIPDTIPSIDTTSKNICVQSSTWDISSANQTTNDHISKSDSLSVRESISSSSRPAVLIEDFGNTFSGGNGAAMDHFFKALIDEKKNKPVRIAVLGDSFIEGDIITADLREIMQDMYGGSGIGFIPFSSEMSKYRGTIKHSYSGWATYNLIQRKSAPEAYRDCFFVSGITSVPYEGAKSNFEGVAFRKHIKKFSTAKLLFVNNNKSCIHITVNDSIKHDFHPESSPNIQELKISADISKLSVTISSAEGFVGYGAVLDGHSGISVDNFSLRGNSGIPLFGTNSSINSQINKLLGYDLIIIEYGLNALTANVTNYTAYGAQLTKLVKYIKMCFPGSSIMVMGVGDRSTMRDGSFVTMPGVKGMLSTQRKVAEECGVAFWSVFDAMGGENSMVTFVERNWAAKDYTHISYAGGKHIAKELVRSFLYGKESLSASLAPEVPDGPTATLDTMVLTQENQDINE